MRTNEEIVARIKDRQKSDWLGFEITELIACLPYEDAKHFLSDDVTADDWKTESQERDAVIERMREYMPFAWEKANNGRGISASRSMGHYASWVWLAGDDLGDITDYEFYGKDNLVRICNHYGWDSAEWDDGVRHN